jgi:mono/diheme cytochrome c family protein
MRNAWWKVAAALLLAVVSGCGGGEGGAGGTRARSAGAEAPGDSGPPPGQLPSGVTAAQGSEGRRLYRAACVMCHGERADGTQLGPSLVDSTWSRGSGTFEEVIAVVTEGAEKTEEFGVPMPPRGNGALTDAQIRAVAAYTFSLARPAGSAAR